MKSNIKQLVIWIATVCIASLCLVGCKSHVHEYEHVFATRIVYSVVNEDVYTIESELKEQCKIIKEFLFSKGYTESIVAIDGNNITVDMLYVDDETFVKYLLSDIMPTTVSFVLDKTQETIVTNADIVRASCYYSSSDGGYVVALEFTPEGQDKFYEATSNHINETMSIILAKDGESTTISSPTINSPISGNAIISGNFTEQSAQTLVDQINKSLVGINIEQEKVEHVEYDRCTICGYIKTA